MRAYLLVYGCSGCAVDLYLHGHPNIAAAVVGLLMVWATELA